MSDITASELVAADGLGEIQARILELQGNCGPSQADVKLAPFRRASAPKDLAAFGGRCG